MENPVTAGPERRQGEIFQIAAAVLPLSVTPAAITMAPGMVQGMVDYLGFSQAQAGFIASAEVFGILAGTIVFAVLSSRASWSRTLFLSLLLAVIFNLASIGQRNYQTLLLMRIAAGLGEGLVTGVSWNLLGQTRDPSRSLGWGTAGIILFAAGGFAILPTLYTRDGYSGLMLFLAVSAAICLPFSLFVRHRPQGIADDVRSGCQTAWSLKGVSALVSFLALSLSYPMAWTYMSLVGRGAGLSDAAVNQVFSTTQIFGVAGALLIAGIGASFGYTLPALLILGTGAASIAFTIYTSGALAFFIENSVFLFAWDAGIPLILGIIAARDADGGLFRYAIPLQFVGMAAAPGIAALLLDGERHDAVIWCSAALALLSLVALTPLLIEASSISRTSSNQGRRTPEVGLK